MVTTTHDSKRKSIQIYLLAAPEDKMVCEDIVKHLKPITMNSPRPIEVSSDFNIPAGADTEKYKQRVFDADIVLALISADFIDNDDIYSRNQKVIARQNNQETILIPILVRNFMWRATPFGSMGVVLPKNYQPLNNKQFWNSPDDAVMAVVSEIYDSINALPQQKIEEVQAPPPVQEAPVKPSPIQAEPPAPAKELVQAQTEIVQTALPSQEAPVKPASSKVETPPLAKEPVQAQAKAVQPAPALHAEKVSAPPAPKVSSTPSTGQTMASLPIADDWRRKYYRTVLLKRGAAILLDQIIIVFVPLVLLVIVIPDIDNGLLSIIMYGIYFVVMPMMESSKRQGTIGKRIMKLQITNKDGERVTFLRAFWRNIMRTLVLYSYVVSFGIVLLIQLFTYNKTKKLFHDQLSGTVIGERLLVPVKK